jgi:two-component system NtrC family response regulator
VLVVDDEVEVCTFFRHLLTPEQYDVTTVRTVADALASFAPGRYELALVDIKLPDGDGLSVLRAIRDSDTSCRVIVMTGYSTVRAAIEAIRLGAYDYLEKPFDDIYSLEKSIAAACAGERRASGWAQVSSRLDLIVGTSPVMVGLMQVAEKIARRDVTVLLTGETGTGKELLARFIHAASRRSAKACFSVNCAALTETLLESELFGHERGAFTGAVNRKRGIFELADGGTLFLDEIADASPAIQAKLLRVLETGEFMRVGGEQILKTDVRVMAATNKDLEAEVREGRFREDLLYRLDVASMRVPPLRERREDLPLFLDYFMRREQERQSRETDAPALRLSDAAEGVLLEYDWPGNVRELANVMATAAALCGGGLILPEHLPRRVLERTRPHAAGPNGASTIAGSGPSLAVEEAHIHNEPETGTGAGPEDSTAKSRPSKELTQLAGLGPVLDGVTAEAEALFRAGETVAFESALLRADGFRDELARRVIKRALAHTLGDRRAAAGALGISVRTLRYLLREKK